MVPEPAGETNHDVGSRGQTTRGLANLVNGLKVRGPRLPLVMRWLLMDCVFAIGSGGPAQLGTGLGILESEAYYSSAVMWFAVRAVSRKSWGYWLLTEPRLTYYRIIAIPYTEL